ncbi:MAG: hypothetical protein HQ521_17290 [Bacteroidetes bacterium]|nr:hypothetical protein [Bacteroidota bacterium]
MHFLKHILYIIIVPTLFFLVVVTGCKSKKIITKPEPSKVNTANQQGKAVEYEEAVKHHFDMQSDRTKRMMIKSDKVKIKKNAGQNRQWYDQLFNNSCYKNSAMVKTGHMHSTITNNSSCFIKD